MTKVILNEGRTIANIAEANGYQGISETIQNHFDMKLAKTQTHPLAVLIRMKKGRRTLVVDVVKSGLRIINVQLITLINARL